MAIYSFDPKEDKQHPIIQSTGGMPPLDDIPRGLDIQDMLLYTAWVHGLEEKTGVDKWALILFIQTHIKNLMAQKIEDVLSTSMFWEKDRTGKYRVSALGQSEIKRFGDPMPEYHMTIKYSFVTEFEGKTYGVSFDANGKKSTYLNGHLSPAPLVLKRLKETEVRFYSDSTWPPDIIYDWIIDDTNYMWKRNPQ